MLYNNLIYFLIVILLLTLKQVPEAPELSARLAASIFLFKGLGFFCYLSYLYAPKRVTTAKRYFAAELRGSACAIAVIAIDIFNLDCQYWFSRLPLGNKLPMLTSAWGLVLFFCYLAMMWNVARPCYQQIFGRVYSRSSFVFNNLRSNLPIVLPWFLLSLLFDVLELIPWSPLHRFLNSSYSELAVFPAFILIIAIILPVVMTKLWGCVSLPPGETRQRIEEFCEQERIGYRDIVLWPLFEGQVLTAGVMGFVRQFRYLLVTPALLRALTPVEIEAVMAHEIGHVKRHHMLLYVIIFLGFIPVEKLAVDGIIQLLLKFDLFYWLATKFPQAPEDVLHSVWVVISALFLILYFRFVFGFFMRNFERQADLYAAKTMGTSIPLIQVFERIAALSGGIRDLPSWHHFGLGQRIEYLLGCEQNTRQIDRHHRKIYGALVIYILLIAGTSFAGWHLPDNQQQVEQTARFSEAVILYRIEQEPDNHVWHQLLGDLQAANKEYSKAIDSYTEAIRLRPDNSKSMNNLAWLLLTAEDRNLRDASRALVLAREAVEIDESSHILDTLATAFWQNGFKELAIDTEARALELEEDPQLRNDFSEKLKKFANQTYDPAQE